MPDAASISLYADLNISFAALVADRLDSEDGRVGVSTNHRNGVTRLIN